MANEFHITDLMRLFLRRSKLSDDYWSRRIRQVWLDEYGPQWEHKILDLRFKSGTLYLTLHSAALKSEIHLQKSRIIERLNARIGSHLIRNIYVQ